MFGPQKSDKSLKLNGGEYRTRYHLCKSLIFKTLQERDFYCESHFVSHLCVLQAQGYKMLFGFAQISTAETAGQGGLLRSTRLSTCKATAQSR